MVVTWNSWRFMGPPARRRERTRAAFMVVE
jgi:hypothetical protein